MRMLIPNNVGREGQTASISFNIRENERNVEWLFRKIERMLKQMLKAFALALICAQM